MTSSETAAAVRVSPARSAPLAAETPGDPSGAPAGGASGGVSGREVAAAPSTAVAAPTVSLTLLSLPPRDPLAQLVFWFHTLRSRAQLQRAEGMLEQRLWAGTEGYHTATLWRSETDLLAFYTSGPHRRAMRAFGWLRRRGTRSASLRYPHPDPAAPGLPGNDEVERRFAERVDAAPRRRISP